MKILALCSAVGLAGGYVWQRQNAAAKPAAAEETEERADAMAERAVMPGSKSAVIVGEPKVQATGDLVDRIVLSGSKSGKVILPEGKPERVLPPATEEEKKAEERTILPGSKSFQIVPPQAPRKEP